MTPLLLDRQLFEWFWQDFCLRQAVDDFLLNAFLDLLPLGGGGGGVGLLGDDAVLHWLGSPASSLPPARVPLGSSGLEQVLSTEGLEPLEGPKPPGFSASLRILAALLEVEDLAQVENGAGRHLLGLVGHGLAEVPGDDAGVGHLVVARVLHLVGLLEVGLAVLLGVDLLLLGLLVALLVGGVELGVLGPHHAPGGMIEGGGEDHKLLSGGGGVRVLRDREVGLLGHHVVVELGLVLELLLLLVVKVESLQVLVVELGLVLSWLPPRPSPPSLSIHPQLAGWSRSRSRSSSLHHLLDWPGLPLGRVRGPPPDPGSALLLVVLELLLLVVVVVVVVTSLPLHGRAHSEAPATPGSIQGQHGLTGGQR